MAWRRFLEPWNDAALRLSAITVGELARGVALEARRNPPAGEALRAWLETTLTVFVDRLVAFTPSAARIWGALAAEIGHAGADLPIAASALDAGMTVATRNVADFRPTGVRLVDPFVT